MSVLRLIEDWSWVHRRVDQLRLTDETTLHRRVSVDFTLPSWAGAPYRTQDGVPVHYVPLTLLSKRELTHFDLRDETGRTLPLLSSRRNRQLTTAVLVAGARAALAGEFRGRPKEVPQDLLEDIWDVAHSNPADATERIRRLLHRSTHVPDDSRLWRHLLAARPSFTRLAYDLARNVVIVVPLPVRPAERRIVKYAYDHHVRLPRTRPGSALRRLGARHGRAAQAGAGEFERLPKLRLRRWVARAAAYAPKSVVVGVPAVAQARSYHAELASPDGMQITRLKLFSYRPTDKDTVARNQEVRTLQRSHVYVSGIPRGVSGILVANLRPYRGSILRTGAIVSLFTALVIAAAAASRADLQREAGAAVALLLFVPGGLSAYVARPRDDLFASSALFGVRLLALAPGLAGFLAAGTLVVGRTWTKTEAGVYVVAGPRGLTDLTLSALAAGSLLVAAVFAVSLYRAMYPPEQRRPLNSTRSARHPAPEEGYIT